jgi:hypothetical protein
LHATLRTLTPSPAPTPAAPSAPASRHKRLRFPHDFGLSLVIFSIFIILAVIQTFVGLHEYNNHQHDFGLPAITYGTYLTTGLCWESLAENWESEFLEMAAFVWLTSFLYQRGSPQSDDPDDEGKPEAPLTERSPWPARKGGWIAAAYSHSLTWALLLLFFLSLVIHIIAGAAEYNRQQRLHHQPTVTTTEFMGTSAFWFQSLQNWQSEFLGIGAMVVLSIWLRQKGSAESKDVNTPHVENE